MHKKAFSIHLQGVSFCILEGGFLSKIISKKSKLALDIPPPIDYIHFTFAIVIKFSLEIEGFLMFNLRNLLFLTRERIFHVDE